MKKIIFSYVALISLICLVIITACKDPMEASPAPTYGITLSQTGTYTFTEVVQGYSGQTSQSVTVTNTGNRATGMLTVALSGTNANCFTLSSVSLNSIAAGGSIEDAFTIIPNDDLAAGTYTATVTVSGRNNISAQFNIIFTVGIAGPSAPQNFTATPGNTRVVLSWAAPSSDGGSAITGYRVSGDNGVSWLTASSNTGHTFTGLANDMSYTFQVCAVNAAGNGAAASAVATPVYSAGNAQFTVTFAQITDISVSPIYGPTISHSGTPASEPPNSVTVTLDNADQYTSIIWRITGASITGTGPDFTLTTAGNPVYTILGEHFLTVEVMRAGIPYNQTIVFTVAP